MSRRTKNIVVILVAVVAAGLAAALIAVSATGGDGNEATVTVEGADATAQLLEGIPQVGPVLGRADAPVTIVEYADLQCPACQFWALSTFPTLVDEYVRPGKAKIVFNGVAFLGPDSLTALKTAFAAGEQNKLWNVVELLFHNQGEENAGWVTEDLLRAIGDAVPELDTDTMLDDRDSEEVAASLATAQGTAQAAGLAQGPTPSFDVGRSGGQTVRIEGAASASDFRRLLDSVLAQQ